MEGKTGELTPSPKEVKNGEKEEPQTDKEVEKDEKKADKKVGEGKTKEDSKKVPPKSFARRYQPSTEPGKARWAAIKAVFEQEIKPHVSHHSKVQVRFGKTLKICINSITSRIIPSLFFKVRDLHPPSLSPSYIITGFYPHKKIM